jgi:predicted nucleic acid-binding protein
MNAVFVDTGGWMACADRADPAHASCRAARDSALEAGQTRSPFSSGGIRRLARAAPSAREEAAPLLTA